MNFSGWYEALWVAAGLISLYLILTAAAILFIDLRLQRLLPSTGGAAGLSSAALCWQPVELHVQVCFPGVGLVAHGAVTIGVVVGHGVVVGGGVRDDAHEERDQREVVNKGEQKRGVYREEGDGAHGGHHGGGGRFYAFFAELHGGGVTDAGHPEGLVGDPREVWTREQQAES